MAGPKIDIPNLELVGIRYELSLLEEHLESVERQVETKKKASREALNERLESLGKRTDGRDFRAERQIARNQHRHRVDDLIPRIFVHPFVVATWSTYQSGTKELTNRLADLHSAKRALADEDRKHFCGRVEKFLSRLSVKPGYTPASRLVCTGWWNFEMRLRTETRRYLS